VREVMLSRDGNEGDEEDEENSGDDEGEGERGYDA